MAMNCDTFKQNIDAYLDGELTEEQQSEMDAHADECSACQEALEQAVSLSSLCAELNEELSVPLEAQAAWRRAVREEANKKRRPISMWTRGLGTVAAALVVLVTGTLGMRMQENAPAFGVQMASVENSPYIMRTAEESTGMDGVTAGRFVATGSLQSDGSMDSRMGSAAAAAEENPVEAVVLRSAERSIQTANYDADFMWLQDLVSEYDAWFEERTVTVPLENEKSSGRVASAVVRVPSEWLDDFLTELDQLGQTVMRSESAEDVTGRYVDTQSRLEALKMQKDKLNEMLAGCEDVAELIAIDDKLTDVIASMEALEGDLRRWESQRSYSRVALTLTELVEAPAEAARPLADRMKAGFDESVEWLGEFGQDALVVLASVAPRLVIWIPAAVLVAIVLWAIFRRRK